VLGFLETARQTEARRHAGLDVQVGGFQLGGNVEELVDLSHGSLRSSVIAATRRNHPSETNPFGAAASMKADHLRNPPMSRSVIPATRRNHPSEATPSARLRR